MISGSFDISPSNVGFNGELCRFTWYSNNATFAFIPEFGILPPEGSRYLYVYEPKTFTITFSNTIEQIQINKSVTVDSDPLCDIRFSEDNTTQICVVRNVQEHIFNKHRPPDNGTAFYIISSTHFVPILALSDEDFAVL